jgi:hypothetical protein
MSATPTMLCFQRSSGLETLEETINVETKSQLEIVKTIMDVTQ